MCERTYATVNPCKYLILFLHAYIASPLSFDDTR